MSKPSTPSKRSPPKHKGVKTSLINSQYQNQQQSNYHPNKIYVQTVYDKNLPNVLPYIDSGYNNNQSSFGVNQAASQYVPAQNDLYQLNQSKNLESHNINSRHNNHIYINRHPVIQNVHVSPMHLGAARIDGNLSKSKFVPPPPETFLVSPGNQYTHSQPFIHQNQPLYAQQPIILPSQSVKKTYVPQHVINQIPIIYTTPDNRQHAQNLYHQQQNNQQSQQILLGYYQKIYEKLQIQKQQNYNLRNKLAQTQDQLCRLRDQPTAGQPLIKKIVQRIEVPVQRKKKIDIQKLYLLLEQNYIRTANQVISRRKNSCLYRLGKLFNDGEILLKKISSEVRVQQSSVTVRP